MSISSGSNRVTGMDILALGSFTVSVRGLSPSIDFLIIICLMKLSLFGILVSLVILNAPAMVALTAHCTMSLNKDKRGMPRNK